MAKDTKVRKVQKVVIRVQIFSTLINTEKGGEDDE